MLILLMSNSDLFDKLYQEINRQNAFYFWIVGIALSIAVAVTAFFGILQWRLSDKQIEKMKSDAKKDIVKEYQLDDLNNRLENLEKEIKELSSKHLDLSLGSIGGSGISQKDFKKATSLTKKLEIRSLIAKLPESDDAKTDDLISSIEESFKELTSDNDNFLDNAVFVYEIYSELLKESDKKYAAELISFLESNARDLINGGKIIKESL